MRQDNIEFAAAHSVVMVTNHKPTVGGDDPAQWRRLRIVPFDVVVANPNKRLKEQLAVELPAVLAWLVAGNTGAKRGERVRLLLAVIPLRPSPRSTLGRSRWGGNPHAPPR